MFISLSFILALYSYTEQIPNPGHGADEVFININGKNIDLQTAIANGEFNSAFTGTGIYSENIIHGHSGEEIIINVNGEIKTFQQAINDGSLCNAEQGTSPSNFGTITGQKQTGDEILIDFNGEKTLQEAINNEEFSACIVREPINLALTGTPSLTYSGGEAWCGCSWYPAGWRTNYYLLNNNNLAEGVGVCVGNGPRTETYSSVIILDSIASQVNKIEYYALGAAYGQSGTITTSIYSEGTWKDIHTRSVNIGDFSFNPRLVEITSGGPWYNVEQVKVHVVANAAPYYCIQSYIFEIKVWGN